MMETMTADWADKPVQEIIRSFTDNPPVNIVGLAEALGIKVWEKPMPTFSGMVMPDDINGGRSGYSIYVNSEDSLNRRRFTIAHEIAHYLLHRNKYTGSFKDDRMYRSPGVSSASEAEANRLAADLLMPRRLIRKLLAEGISDPYLMANQLQVSSDAMQVRLGLRSKFNPHPKRNIF